MEHEHLKPKDKVVTRMTREGAVEENLTESSSERISQRLQEPELVKPQEIPMRLSFLTVLMGQQSCIRRWQCVFRSSRKRLCPLLRHRLPKAVCPHPRHPLPVLRLWRSVRLSGELPP